MSNSNRFGSACWQSLPGETGRPLVLAQVFVLEWEYAHFIGTPDNAENA